MKAELSKSIDKYDACWFDLGGRGSVCRPIAWRLAVQFPLSLLKRLAVHLFATAGARFCTPPPLHQHLLPGRRDWLPTAPVNMASVPMSVWFCACACSTGANLDGWNAEE